MLLEKLKLKTKSKKMTTSNSKLQDLKQTYKAKRDDRRKSYSENQGSISDRIEASRSDFRNLAEQDREQKQREKGFLHPIANFQKLKR